MLPDEDDGEETASGPPPDPSLREWRHPSEVAAAAAAAARPVGEPIPAVANARPRSSVAIAMAACVTAVAGLAMLMAGVGTSEIQVVDDGAAAGPDQPSSRDATVADEAEPEPAELLAESLAGAATVAPSPTEPPATEAPPTTQVPSTAATAPISNPAPVETEPVGAPELGALVAHSAGIAPDDLVDGVFALDGSSLTRVASYAMIDGVIYTSARALGGHQRVALLAGGERWAEADVVGTDPLSDVAVLLVTPGTETAPLAEVASLALPAPESTAGEPGTDVVVAAPHDATPLHGMVIGSDQRTTASDGSPLFGTLQTTVELPSAAIGAAVHDQSTGEVVGLIVSSPRYHVSAIPITTVLEIGQNFLTHGLPALQWIGIEPSSDLSGPVTIAAVVDGSPAATAGLVAGDEIVQVSGVNVDGAYHLAYLIREVEVGASVDVEILPIEGGRAVIEVMVGPRPGAGTGL